MRYRITEVSGFDRAVTINLFNAMEPEIFPALKPHHFENGFWWLAFAEDDPVGFAGLVPFEPFTNVGYLKRAYVLPEHRGHGLQMRFLFLREAKAKELGWHQIASECPLGSVSERSFTRAGYSRCEPEQPWAAPNAAYWIKTLL